MRQVGAILLLFVLSFPQLLQGYAVVDYIINQDLIEETYCENKDKPELECHGTCFLSKEIVSVEEGPDQDQPIPARPDWRSFSEFTVSSLSLEVPSLSYYHDISLGTPYLAFELDVFIGVVAPPPKELWPTIS